MSRVIPFPQVTRPPVHGILFVHPESEPRFVPFPFVRAVIGRDPASGVPLQGRAVSWHHAELHAKDTFTAVRDLDSTNGVQVEGKRVAEARLSEGNLLRIGDFLGVVTDGPWPDDVEAQLPTARLVGLLVGPVMSVALAALTRPLMAPAVLTIEGETGTGKSLVARLAHAKLNTIEAPFVVVDCAGWDANAALPALMKEAAGGSIYLGNFTALAPMSQTRLFAALEDCTTAQITLIAGSQEPLEHALERGDLLPPLGNAFAKQTVHVPPLRARRVEIPALFRELIARHSDGRRPAISTDVIERLCLYDWPCNVRELSLLAQRLLALHGDETRLRLEHLPPHLLPSDREDTTLPVAPVAGVNLNKLLDAVRDAGGNIASAALRLGISRERAYRLIDRLGGARSSS
ncbi:MAG TPA: FHA domain-containing protein [Polyangia bacterium]